MSVVESNVLIRAKDSSGNSNLFYPITKKDNVDGLDELVRNQGVFTSGDGSAYTATVEGITSLTAGASFVMIPHVESTAVNPTLNVNGLGAKLLRRRTSSNTNTTTTGASTDWLASGKPVSVMYDGNWWVVDLPRPNANDIMGTVQIQNGGTGATTTAEARVNLGIETSDGTVTSINADYAEVGEWLDGNPTSEDRVGYFVCIDTNEPGVMIRKGNSNDGIKGVTVTAPAFSGNCSDDKFDENGFLLSNYSYVAITGIVKVIDNGDCIVGERCMPTSDGTAGPISGDYGYLVLNRVDDTHVLISIDPSIAAQYKFKKYIDTEYKNIVHSPDSASVGQTIVVKTVDENGKPTEWETVNVSAFSYENELLLTDRTTGLKYRLYVDNGKLSMEAIVTSASEEDPTLTDKTTGIKYKLYVDSGKLAMESVSTESEV